ncbi:MAG TPA: ZIP family metal transporter [Baekduia sp.]|nr:ZIP family metal transporter [Baekduia sp.]
MIAALAFSAVTFVSTMAGGVTALRWPSRSEWLMALAGGVVLGAALFDLLPEAIEHGQEHGVDLRIPVGAVLVGYLVFNAVERWTHNHDHGHDHHHDAPDVGGLVGAAGFVVHSFFDGLAIGIGFQIDEGVGLLVALAVIGHDFSDGLNTVSLLRAARHPDSRTKRWLVAVSSAPLVGAIVGSIAPVPDEVLPVALGFFCGLFIYAASTHLLPAARNLPALGSVAMTTAGAAVMLAIAQFA